MLIGVGRYDEEVDEWGARWGGRIEISARSRAYYPTPPEGYKFGTTATRLPLLAGLLTIEEQRRDVAEHAMHIAVPEALIDTHGSFPPSGRLLREHPAGRYAEDPYTKVVGSLRCPNGKSEVACYPDSNNRLRGFP
jgi:hypothetical protein